MYEIIKSWYVKNFSDPQAVMLLLALFIVFALILVLGDILAPVLVAVVLSYLMEGVVSMMERFHIHRTLGSAVVVIFSIIVTFALIVGILPLLSSQVSQLIREFPNMMAEGQERLLALPARYPDLFTVEQINEMIASLRTELAGIGQEIVSFSISNVSSLLLLGIYAVLVPLIVFFTLKDKETILIWAGRFFPKNRDLSLVVWKDVDSKIVSYIRGKFIEVVIVWVATYVTFALLSLNYAMLLSFLVGISVIVPFVGAVAVTVPVAIIAFYQWGVGPEFWTLLIAYQFVQILDGNVLVPLLFSEVVNLHPIGIIVAVLFFGGLWGVWGVFFAIPLATLIQAVLNAWPDANEARIKHV